MAEALSPILPPALEALTQQVLNEACLRELKLATAESCTGGLIASLLTDVPGCSHAFERGFVTYTNEAKQELVGVSPATLAQHGPVSEPTAREMAAGALAGSAADVAVAVTGWTEKGPDPNQPAGQVWFAVARRGRSVEAQQACFGDVGRAAIRVGCLEVALKMMLNAITTSQ